MRTINDELKKLIIRGRGDGRNIEEYAKKMGISAAALYRIMNGKIKKPLSDKIIRALVDNAAEGSNLTYEEVSYTIEKYLYFKNYGDDVDEILTTRRNQMYHSINKLFSDSGIPYAGLPKEDLYLNGRGSAYFDFGFRAVLESGEERYLFKVSDGSLPFSGFGYDIDLFGGQLMHLGLSNPSEWYYLVVLNDHQGLTLSGKKENIDNLINECKDFVSYMHEGVLAITSLGSENYHIKRLSFCKERPSITLDSDYYGMNVDWEDYSNIEKELHQ